MSQEDAVADRLESRLMSHGMYLTAFEETAGTYRLEYESLYADEGIIPHREVGRVINTILELHDDEWTGARIEAVVTDLAGTPEGEWYVEREWLVALRRGELSEVEFSANVIETLEF